MDNTNNIQVYTNLLKLNTNVPFVIKRLSLPVSVKNRLSSINLIEGRIYTINKFTLNGIILFDIKYKTKIFLGKNIASKIEVDKLINKSIN